MSAPLNEEPSTPEIAPPPSPIPHSRVVGICLALAILTFAVFGQTIGDKFINYDDPDYVLENTHVTQGLTWRGVVWAFSQFHASNWHPLTWISHMVDCQLYGLEPSGHHLTNVLLHTATVVVLFLVLLQMTGALWRSALVAAVFAVHPLRAESVAWVSERKDVLSGFFFVLTVWAYVRYVQKNRGRAAYGLVLLFYLLGLLSKPMLVTVPLVLLLLDYWPLQRVEKLKSLILEKAPLLALTAASCVVTLLAQQDAMKSTDVFPLTHRLVNAVLACTIYLAEIFYPAGLVPFYPFPRHGLPGVAAASDAAILGIITFMAWTDRKTRPWLLMGWIWYFVMIFPVVGIVQVGAQAHADRYTYLPQIGIYIALVWLAAEWAMNKRIPKAVAGGAMAGVVAVLAVLGWKQVTYWKDSESLWKHTLDATPDNAVAFLNLGHHLFNKGRLNEAAILFKRALETNPDNPDFHNNLGKAYDDEGHLDEAIVEYKKAVEEKAFFPEAEYNLGKIYAKKGRFDEAIIHFQNSIKIQPNYGPAHLSLGTALLQRGRAAEAAAEFQELIEFKPNDAGAHLNLGLCYVQLGRTRSAIEQYRETLRLTPSDPGVQNNLAWLLATGPDPALRNGAEALELAQEANSHSGGNNALILHTLAAAFAEAGRFPEAVETAQKAASRATEQSQTALVKQLQLELGFYRGGKPYHGE